MDVTVVVAWHGTPQWEARSRVAAASVPAGVPVTIATGDTLADARNHGASHASTDWLCFLDADDQLAPDYFHHMAAADNGTDQLLAPALLLTHPNGRTEHPNLAARDIEAGWNPCCIGTLIRRDTFHRVGGFGDEPAYEDYALFLRATRSGATIRHVPDAWYRAHVNPTGRNSTVTNSRALVQSILAAS